MEGQRDIRRDDYRPTGTITPEADPRLQRAYDRDARAVYEEPVEVVTPVEARQGGRGRPLLYALVLGLILAAAFVIGMQTWTVSEDVPETAALEQPLVTPTTPAVPVPATPADPAAAPILR